MRMAAVSATIFCVEETMVTMSDVQSLLEDGPEGALSTGGMARDRAGFAGQVARSDAGSGLCGVRPSLPDTITQPDALLFARMRSTRDGLLGVASRAVRHRRPAASTLRLRQSSPYGQRVGSATWSSRWSGAASALCRVRVARPGWARRCLDCRSR